MASVSVRRGGSVRDVTAALVDSSGGVIPVASEFLSYVSLRGCSPNTVLAYAYDLAHLWRFFEAGGLSWDQLTPQRSPELLVYFRALPSNRRDGACRARFSDKRRRAGRAAAVVAGDYQPRAGGGVGLLRLGSLVRSLRRTQPDRSHY